MGALLWAPLRATPCGHRPCGLGVPHPGFSRRCRRSGVATLSRRRSIGRARSRAMITYDEQLDRATIAGDEQLACATLAYDRELDREHHLARLRRFAVL